MYTCQIVQKNTNSGLLFCKKGQKMGKNWVKAGQFYAHFAYHRYTKLKNVYIKERSHMVFDLFLVSLEEDCVLLTFSYRRFRQKAGKPYVNTPFYTHIF